MILIFARLLFCEFVFRPSLILLHRRRIGKPRKWRYNQIMEKSEITSQESRFFSFFSLFWVILGWFVFASALAGLFYFLTLVGFFCAAAAAFLYFIAKRGKKIPISDEFCCVILVILGAAFLFSFFATPSIFSGRDQGSISEAAIRLVQNNQLRFSTPASEEFFQIYGPGRALNFPGFHYDSEGNLTTQFPLVYIAWLAFFYALFSLKGLIVANAVLLILFLGSFYFSFRLLSGSAKYSALLLLFALTSFSFVWFFKFTLSENMALALIWICVLNFILLRQKTTSFHYFSFLAPLGLLFFTRIEGIAFFFTGIALLAFSPKIKEFILKDALKNILLPLIVFGAFLSFNTIQNFYFYKEVGRVIFSNLSFEKAAEFSFAEKITAPGMRVLGVFFLYGLINFFVLGIIEIITLIRNKKYILLAPFFFAAPTFVYFIDSHISSDHPWMLRRFMFSLLPVLIFYAVFAFYEWEEKLKKQKRWNFNKKIIFSAVFLLLLAFNIRPTSAYFTFSENKNLLAETESLAKNFQDGDLALIDRMSSGDGWAMISGPLDFLFGKNAVYFFNPDDLEKIRAEKFNDIYLIVPENRLDFYTKSAIGGRLEEYKNYSVIAKRLKISDAKNKHDQTPIKLPVPEKTEIHGKIFKIKKDI